MYSIQNLFLFYSEAIIQCHISGYFLRKKWCEQFGLLQVSKLKGCASYFAFWIFLLWQPAELLLLSCVSTERWHVSLSESKHCYFPACLLQHWFPAVCINRAFYGGPWMTLQCLHPAFITRSYAVFTVTEGERNGLDAVRDRVCNCETGVTPSKYQGTKQESDCALCMQRVGKKCWCAGFPCFLWVCEFSLQVCRSS